MIEVIDYLHQCLGIVASPLFEVAALLEPSETRKQGCKCDTVKNYCWSQWTRANVPSIDFIKNTLGLRGPMDYLQVILNPLNEVILECTLDDLMEKVGGEKFMNVCAWEPHHERLQCIDENHTRTSAGTVTHLEIWDNTVVVP